MSIDKIKKMIYMIENNDFSTENNISENIKGSSKQLRRIFTKADDKTINNISKLDANLTRTNNLHNKWLGSDSPRVTVTGKSNIKEDIPNKDKNVIFLIYTVLKNKNILPTDLDSNNFKPLYGYRRSNNGKGLILFNDKLIMLKFDDNRLTNLLELIINRDTVNVTSNDFIDFFNEINNNKSRYGVQNIQLTNGGDTIEINF